jgi:hypothetical protein
MLWSRSSDASPVLLKPSLPVQSHRRHTRKCAEGDLGEDESFYFRGPKQHLNLRAQNLMMFIQIAEGIDEKTWEYHRRAGDYSAWFRKVIKDPELAREASIAETNATLDASGSRCQILQLVSKRYTAPAQAQKNRS